MSGAQRGPHSGAPCTVPTSQLAQPCDAWKALRRDPEMPCLHPASVPSPRADPCLRAAAMTEGGLHFGAPTCLHLPGALCPRASGERGPLGLAGQPPFSSAGPSSYTYNRPPRWLPHVLGRAQKGTALRPVPQGARGRQYLSAESGRGDRNTCASEEFRPALDTVSVTRNWS